MIERGRGESTMKNTGTMVGLAAMADFTEFFLTDWKRVQELKILIFFC